jgi:hypothetical protein
MVAVAPPFGSSKGKYNFLGTAALKNCHAEIRDDNGKARYVIVPADGTTLFSEVSDTPCRGTIFLDDLDLAYTAHSGRVYSVNSAGTDTSLGVVPGQDKVRFARNQKTTPQIVIRCNTGVYVVENSVVAKIIDDDLPSVEDICDHDGYIVYLISDGRFFLSGLNEVTTIDALDFDTAQRSADKGVAAWSWGGFLLIFGRQTIEPFRTTGAADFPFERMPTVIPRGCIGKWTIANCDNTVFFIGDDGIVYRLNGFQPVRVSNHEIERLIQAESDPSVIEAQSWSHEGHSFIEYKGTNWSKAYDANTQQWCDLETYGQTVWRHNNAFRGWNKSIHGDKLTGNLYYRDSSVNTEAGGTQVATIRFPALNVFPDGGVVDALHLDFVTGQGVQSTTAQGHDPILMLRVYKDGGNAISFERNLKTGKRGKYGRVTTRRLGKCGPQGMVFELAMSDPVGRALALADVDVRQLNR